MNISVLRNTFLTILLLVLVSVNSAFSSNYQTGKSLYNSTVKENSFLDSDIMENIFFGIGWETYIKNLTLSGLINDEQNFENNEGVFHFKTNIKDLVTT